MYFFAFYLIPIAGVSLLAGYISNVSWKRTLLIVIIGTVVLVVSSSIYVDTYYVLGGLGKVLLGLPIMLLSLAAFPVTERLVPSNLFGSGEKTGLQNRLLNIISREQGTISASSAAEELGITTHEVRAELQSMANRGLIEL